MLQENLGFLPAHLLHPENCVFDKGDSAKLLHTLCPIPLEGALGSQ